MRFYDWVLPFVLFIVAFASQAILIFSYWIADMSNNDLLTWSDLVLSGVSVILMVALAIATRDMSARWMSAGLIGVVGLAFGALTIISIGLLIAPLALVLTITSCIMLIRSRRPKFEESQ